MAPMNAVVAALLAGLLAAQLLWTRFVWVPRADLNPQADALMGLQAAVAVGLLWCVGLVWNGQAGRLRGPGGWAMGAGLLVCIGAAGFAGAFDARPLALVAFMLGSLGLLAAFRQPGVAAPPLAPSLGAFALLSALGAALVYAGQAAFILLTYDPIARGNTIWMFPRRALMRSDPIPGGAFSDWAWVLAPLAALALVLGGLVWLSRRKSNALQLLGAMVAGALLLKLAVASLSPIGISLLWLKARTVHSSYLYVTLAGMDRMSAMDFLRRFNVSGDLLVVHAGTHGPLPELLYWLLLRLTGGSVVVVTLVYMLLTNLAAWPIFKVTERLTGKSGLGLAAAALWLACPQNLILGNAGFDAALLGLLALSFWYYLQALDAQDWRYAAAAGAFFWLAQLASMVSLVWPAAFALFALARYARQGSVAASLPRWLGLWALWLGLPLLLHLLLWAGTSGDFNYAKTCVMNYTRYATDAAVFHRSRPSYAWLWGNALVFAGYASVPLLLAWGLELKRRFTHLDLAEGFTVPGAFLVLGMGLTVLGLAEVHRDFIWATFFLLPGAARAMESPKPAPKSPWNGVRIDLLALVVSLAVLNAVILEIWVLDQN